VSEATYIVATTSSGAVYAFNNADLTFQRFHDTIDVIGRDADIDGITVGYMEEPMVPMLDESMYILQSDGRWIRTTPVVSVEVV
jgi:hypothetical protein